MVGAGDFKPIDFWGHIDSITNRLGNPLFKLVELNWLRPRPLTKEMTTPVEQSDSSASLYVIFRNHHLQKGKDRIVYVGLTTSAHTRFANHPKAKEIAQRRGETKISFAPVNFIKGRNRVERIKRALEEMEHLLIWTLWNEHIENDRKADTLPGLGAHRATALHIINTGYRFSGQMPREILSPWTLVKRGRRQAVLET